MTQKTIPITFHLLECFVVIDVEEAGTIPVLEVRSLILIH
jgi:hypothetical protein